VEHRLFSLGGDTALRGIPPGQVVGSNQAVGMVEWRWAPIRNASLWLPLIWLTELQVSGGLEGGWVGGLVRDGDLGDAGQGAVAADWVLGVGVAGDWFGARPGLLTLTVARPFWTQGIPEEPARQVYLRGTQAF
jgi:hemolysin activation/secretion protein